MAGCVVWRMPGGVIFDHVQSAPSWPSIVHLPFGLLSRDVRVRVTRCGRRRFTGCVAGCVTFLCVCVCWGVPHLSFFHLHLKATIQGFSVDFSLRTNLPSGPCNTFTAVVFVTHCLYYLSGIYTVGHSVEQIKNDWLKTQECANGTLMP